MNNDSLWLKISDVSRLVKLSPQTLRRHIHQGRVDGAKNFGTPDKPIWRIPTYSRFLQSQKIVLKQHTPSETSFEIFNRL